MPGLILPQRFNAQPQGALQLDRSNPVARGITHMMPMNGDLREIVTGNRVTLTSTGKIEPSSRGLALRGNGSQSVGTIPLDLSASGFLAVSFWLNWDAFANDDDFLMEFTSDVNTQNGGFYINPNASVGRFQASFRIAGIGYKAASFPRPSAGDWHHYYIGLTRTALANLGHVFYVDGVKQTVTNDVNSANGNSSTWANSTLYFFSRNSSAFFGAGRLQNLTIRAGDEQYSADTSTAALTAREEYRNPWGVFKAPPKRVFFGFGGGGGSTSLVIADSTHNHTADALTLSTDWLLAVQDALHAHAADSLTLSTSGSTSLIVADAAHAHAADALILSTDWLLTIADAIHAHAADSPVLTLQSALTVQDAAHAHAADNVVLDTSNQTPLTIADATHGHTADSITLTTAAWLAIADALHAHAADVPTLSLGQVSLLIADALHGHMADNVALSLPGGPEILGRRLASMIQSGGRPRQLSTSRRGTCH